ncbi:hypothetical protein CASFOL_033493 [Castilleja foliolosa]|uniref:HMA domain-containing protein n=1 Tax=Castilleja foliolosa TaxID=1961234 RepID=A0ABD3C0I3_9LAMI
MKKIDIFCASQTATAILCSSIKDTSPSSTPSSSSTAFLLTGGAAIDRHNPIIRDPKRTPKLLTNYSQPQPQIIPKPQNTHHKKSNNNKIPFKETKNLKKIWKCTNPGDFISPPGSTRYLLRDKAVLDPDFESLGGKKLSLDDEEIFNKDVKKTEQILFDNIPPSSSSQSPEQVVALRVSLHCRGCERKLRKHLSRMEGVTSYNIEFAAKKVTVTGNVRAQGVLASISKVKNAQLWSPAISSVITNQSQ